MAAATGVRTDYTSADLRQLTRHCCDADQVQRILAFAVILDGGEPERGISFSRCDAAGRARLVISLQPGGPWGWRHAKRRARQILNDEQRARLAEMV